MLVGELVDEMLGRAEVRDQAVDVPQIGQLIRIVPHVRWGQIDRSCHRRPTTSSGRIRPHQWGRSGGERPAALVAVSVYMGSNQGLCGGASWIRTSDLSIISAAL